MVADHQGGGHQGGIVGLRYSLHVMRGHSPSKTGVNALMTRASIFFARRWIAGSGPAMTPDDSAQVEIGLAAFSKLRECPVERV